MEKSIFDPPLPYIGPIYGGRFAPGKIVRIQGTVPSVAYRFDIYLQCGPGTTPRDDVAVQVSIRILEGFIVVNSLQNGIWDEEQRRLAPPIKRADRFEITILCDFSQYKIAINGQHYCEFPQRIHYDRITHLAMDGDISVIQISYESSAGSGPPMAAVSMPFPLVDNDIDDFEIIDAKKPTPPGLYGAPPAGFAQPPPYGMSVPNNQRAPSPFNPPPAAGPYPVGAPYPTGPGAPNVAPYPTGVPGTVGALPYPPPGAPGFVPPPPGAPIPLNAASSNFRTVKPDNTRKYLAGFGAAFIIIILIVLAVFLKKNRSTRDNSSTYSENNYNSYNNDYSNDNSYSNNRYGGYDNNNYWDRN